MSLTNTISQHLYMNCYFTPLKDLSSSTICANCGQEKMAHTIGQGLKANKVIMHFTQEDENELQRLSTIIHYKQPTYEEMEKADALSREKIKAEQATKSITLTNTPHFKKILVKKDGTIWHLSDPEVKAWEKDGSIVPGDILYRVVTDTIY